MTSSAVQQQPREGWLDHLLARISSPSYALPPALVHVLPPGLVPMLATTTYACAWLRRDCSRRCYRRRPATCSAQRNSFVD